MSNDATPTPEKEEVTSLVALRARVKLMSSVQFGILLLAAAYTIYFIRPVLLPVILALLLTLVLKPIHRVCTQWIKIPAPIVAAFILFGVVTGVGAGLYYLSAPAVEYTDQLRNEIVKTRLQNVFQPISKIQAEVSQVATEVEKITKPKVEEGDGEEAENEKANQGGKPSSEQQADKKWTAATKKMVTNNEDLSSLPAGTSNNLPVSVKLSKSPMEDLYESAKSVVYHLVITMTLVFFLLAYGDKMITRITEVDVTADLMDELTNEVSRYMFTITVINILLGIVIGTAMWLLGMPNPLLWGVMAAILNYIPYIGALCGAAIVFIVAATNFDSTLTIALIPAVYYGITVLEGNFITPAVLGKSFTVNPIIVFIWVLCWAALWGIPGMLIGLPILMVCRIICSKFPGFKRMERIISS